MWTEQMWPDVHSPWRVAIRWEEVDGRLEAVGFSIEAVHGDVPLTTSVLRSVPLAGLVQRSHQQFLKTVRQGAKQHDAEGARYRKALPKYERSAARRGRPPTYGPDHLAEVANVYTEAWLESRPPTKAVAEEFSVSRSAAAKWVARAREQGLLGPTQQRRAGGIK